MDPTIDSHEGDDDMSPETWTQIPGLSGDDLSDSDDSVSDSTVQYRVPTAVQKAERNAMLQLPGPPTLVEIHERYRDFTSKLCKHTATPEASQHVLRGLPVAIQTARSVQLDEDATDNEQLDVFAFALVIYIWQIVCVRIQHGGFPSDQPDDFLCVRWAAYFISAHSLVPSGFEIPFYELRYATEYWEVRLSKMGGGNEWMGWAKDVGTDILDIDNFNRNELASRYIAILNQHGKTALALRIIEEEKKGDVATQIRTMNTSSPESARETIRQLACLLYSMNTSLIKALIQGQLPRLAAIPLGEVNLALRELNEQPDVQPGTYINCICDWAGLSPTPEQWATITDRMLRYADRKEKNNEMAKRIDQKLHPKSEWPPDLADKGLRRYTDWRFYTQNGYSTSGSIHRRWVRYFVDQLKKRMQGQPFHAPLNVPVIEIGFSNDPEKRLRQHRHHESSNYLMNLAEAVFAVEYPGCFQLQQHIIYACFRPIQTWLSEIALTQLAQGYVEGSGGFSHEIAGRSNSVSHSVVPAKKWIEFECTVYHSGRFMHEVVSTIQARRVLAESIERARQQVQEAQEKHKKKLADARERLLKALDH